MPDGARHKYAETLAFRPVRPLADAAMLTSFGRDLYVESLGRDHEFRRDYGARGQKFPLWVAACAAADPDYAALLTENGEAIGLVVLGGGARNEAVGHVHHFYVVPSHRGRGFGGLLDDYARATLRSAGYMRARLNVTATNDRAIRFYLAQGWEKMRERSGAGRLVNMEVAL